ncbi:hypothetical protein M422DRAFT_65789 [Sphaerobolus stellatus SS14]|nr:hypothetical protein M422DRAFT_65789 [Sphaerobolus stellatus SS14]
MAEIEEFIPLIEDIFGIGDLAEGVGEAEELAAEAEELETAAELQKEGQLLAEGGTDEMAGEGGTKSFGEWATREIAKNALFLAGSKAMEKFLGAGSLPDASPEAELMYRISKGLKNATQTTVNIVHDWLNWLKEHYDSRETYGTIDYDDTTILTFRIFQKQVGDLSKFFSSDTAGVLLKAKKTPTLENMRDMETAMYNYCKRVKVVTGTVAQSHGYRAMRDAGLETHVEDAELAFDQIMDIQDEEWEDRGNDIG